MTDPATPTDVPDADRAPATTAGEATALGDGVPEADALEQQLAAGPGEAGGPLRALGDREADEADLLEQETEVPLDDDEPS